MTLCAKPLAGKVAIVTGGAAGIGWAITKSLVKAGAKVGVFDLKSTPPEVQSDSIHFVETNITSEDSIKNAIQNIKSRWGGLDVLVNNAGIMDRMARTGDTSNDTWNQCLAINVTGPFYITRLAIQSFLEEKRKGSIINMCSTASIRGAAAGAAYTTSKHALLGLSRSTAWAYAKEGIRCNAIFPGGVATHIMKNIKVDEPGQAALMPFMGTMPGLCHPSDIAEAVLFLATANAVNGAEIAVDQGWTTS